MNNSSPQDDVSIERQSDTEKEVASPRRRLSPEQSRSMILDATERLMCRDGYAAISTRSVAAEAGIKPSLVHYYFPKTDDLLLAFYRRSAVQTRQRIEEALASDRPIHALWEVNANPQRMALAAEFMALANHRKSIRTEIAQNVELFREMQSKAFAKLSENNAEGLGACSPAGAAVLLAAVARALVMEQGIGITAGHTDARAFVEWCINCVEKPS